MSSSTAVPMLCSSAGPRMVHVNCALLALVGYEREELLGKDPVDVFVYPNTEPTSSNIG